MDIWNSLPPDELVRELEYFDQFINAESNDLSELPQEISDSVLDGIIDKTFEKPKRFIAKVIYLTKKPEDGPINMDEQDILTIEPILNLATSVFSCRHCEADKSSSNATALVGWNQLRRHLYCFTRGKLPAPKEKKGNFSVPLRLERDAAGVVLSLLRLLGLDPSTTTASEMDELDPRFACLDCKPLSIKGMKGHEILDWRECVKFLPLCSVLISG